MMVFILLIIGIWLLRVIIHSLRDSDKDSYTKNYGTHIKSKGYESPCRFSDGISEEEFENIVHLSKKELKIARLKQVYVLGASVTGKVVSQSNISEWYFKLNFNDHGHLTGRYSITSENEDSNIPRRFGDTISAHIVEYKQSKREK